jgi:hypothetical protein
LIEYLVVGVCWLLLSLPVSVFLGTCIAVGQAGEDERHAAAAARQGTMAALQPPVTADSGADTAAVPAQRQPTVGTRLVS